jgi:hypothetical protein
MASQQYVGRWVSPSREPAPNPDGSTSYLVRDFTLTPDRWTLHFSAYGDASSEESKLFAATVEGAYRTTGPSPKVPGAEEAEFDFEKVTFTPHMDFFIGMLNAAKAGNGNWKVGEGQDVSATGALFFAPTSVYSREFDLLKRDGDTLYLGKRPADNNLGSPDRRPEALAAPLAKR